MILIEYRVNEGYDDLAVFTAFSGQFPQGNYPFQPKSQGIYPGIP